MRPTPPARLRLLQIARVEALSEPAVDRSQKIAGLLHLALVAPEVREAHLGGARSNLARFLVGQRDDNAITGATNELKRVLISRW
jgi:hypothetical protein